MAKGTCAIDDCNDPIKGRGWCAMHYSRWQRHGDPHFTPPTPPKNCQTEGCGGANESAGYCRKHYSRLQRHGDLIGKQPRDPMRVKFWRRVTKSDGCWEWRPPLSSAGYGVIVEGGRRLYAHRYSYELHHGPIPSGMNVCHRCDNPPCVRPDHLFLGTQSDNMQDMWNKGRRGGTPTPRSKETSHDL